MRSTRLISIMVATSLAAAAGIATMTWIGASAANDVVRLHLGTDARYFSLGTVTQPITVGKNSCAINSAEPLIDLSSGGNQSAPGYADLGLGVKGSPSSGNGSPCAQIDPAEVLTLRPGTNLPNRTFKSLRLDLEMRGNAVVVVTVSRTVATVTRSEVYRLQTGTSIDPLQAAEPDYDIAPPYFATSAPLDDVDACASPNSSGPNSSGSDNCQWTVTPGFNFDTIALTTTVGTVTLEGSGDFANDPNFDSLFYLSNAAPSAINDAVTTNEDTAVTFNVLTNDSDADGNTLTVSGNTQPTNGSVGAALTNGSFTYTPAANYNGPDSFTYTVTDGTDSSTATVNITVTPVNDPPVAANDAVTTNEDTAVTLNVLSNDSDLDSPQLTASITTGPLHGAAVAALPNGSFTYTPAANYNGPDSFTYTVGDGTASSNPATVSITVTAVNDPPVSISGTATTPEETAVAIPVATDVDSIVLTATCSSSAGGVIVDGGLGSVTFTPPLNFNGSIQISCNVVDDQGAQTATSATVTVGVTAVNDPPIANPDSAEVNQNASVVISVLANDTDVDIGAALVVGSVVTQPSNGLATAGPGSITYTPNANFFGTDSFTYVANDGMVNSNAATVTVTVFPVICSGQSVSDTDGNISGTFFRLTDSQACKRYTIDANSAQATVLFDPQGTAQVDYRGLLSFEPQSAPAGVLNLLLEYDPTGGTTFRPVLWCINPQFNGNGEVTTATLPVGETWCIASESSRGNAVGNVVTTWQVFGQDDPRFQ